MANKKLKEILKESNVWDRDFGDSLPTLKDCEERFTKKQANKVTEEKIEEAGKYNVSSKPFDAWKEHDGMNDKLYRDLHWAMKAFPNKKKEIKKLMKLSAEKGDLIKIIMGQAIDL